MQRAREAAGYLSRPTFVKELPIGLTSLVKLETGKAVGATVYEAVGRELGRTLQGWDVDTPRVILDGGPIPPNDVEPPPEPDLLTPQDDFELKVVRSSLSKEEMIDWIRWHRGENRSSGTER